MPMGCAGPRASRLASRTTTRRSRLLTRRVTTPAWWCRATSRPTAWSTSWTSPAVRMPSRSSSAAPTRSCPRGTPSLPAGFRTADLSPTTGPATSSTAASRPSTRGGERFAATSACRCDGSSSLALLGAGGALALRRASLQLAVGHVLDLRRERPPIAERIGDLAAAMAVELVLHGLRESPAGGDGLADRLVRVGNGDEELHVRTLERERAHERSEERRVGKEWRVGWWTA